MARSTTTSRNVMTQIGITTGIGGMHIWITAASLCLTTVSGLDWIMDFFRGITFPTTPKTTTHTITTRTACPTITTRMTLTQLIVPRSKPSRGSCWTLAIYNGSIDGVFGPSTRDAVAKFQIAKQLNVTGSLSPDTLQSLNLPQGTAS